MMPRTSITLVVVALVALACATEPPESTCVELCRAAAECAAVALDDGNSPRKLEEIDASIRTCTTACGGQWEPVRGDLGWTAQSDCSSVPDALPLGLLPAGGLDPDDMLERPDDRCLAQLAGPSACRTLAGEGAQADCLVAQVSRRALQTGDGELCASLPEPWRQFCQGVALGDSSRCQALPAPFGPGCIEFVEGRARSPFARFLKAIADRDPSACIGLDGAVDLPHCQALASGDPAFCSSAVQLTEQWATRVGSAMRRSSRVQEGTVPRGVVGAVHTTVGGVALLVIPWLLYWLWCHVVPLFRRRDAGFWMLVGGGLSYVGLRGLAVTGPINFVEFERIFVPDSGDGGRLGYTGFPYLVRPLLSVVSQGYEALYLVNGAFGLLAILGLYQLARALGAGGRTAGLAALLLGAQPVVARVAASASETMAFGALSLVLLSVLARWADETRVSRLGALLVILPLLLFMRPEGPLLFPLAFLAMWRGVGGWATRWREWSIEHRASALGVGLLFLAVGSLSLLLPRPPTPVGLWWQNLGEFIADLAQPSLAPVLLVAAGLCGATVATVSRGGRRLAGVSCLLWTLLLVVAWGLQGSEKNRALGAARYLVLWLPWLALGTAVVLDGRRWTRWMSGLVAVVLAAGLLQGHLLTQPANLTLELRSYQRILAHVPEGALLVLPAAPSDNPEYTPEAAPLALLALSGRSARWLTVAEALARPEPVAGACLLRGLYQPEEAERLRVRWGLSPVATESLKSRPDVGPHGTIPEGEVVEVGLYCDRSIP